MSNRRKSNEPKVVSSPLLTFIGSLPLLSIIFFCCYLLYLDYSMNNYSFTAKNFFYSNSNPNELFEQVAHTSSLSEANTMCARFFSDFIITDDEAKTLLRFAKLTFNNDDQDEILNLNDLTNSSLPGDEEFKNVYG